MTRIVDEFDGTSLSSDWTVVNPFSTQTPIVYTVSDGNFYARISENDDYAVFKHNSHLNKFKSFDVAIGMTSSGWEGDPTLLEGVLFIITDSLVNYTNTPNSPATQAIYFEIDRVYDSGLKKNKITLVVDGFGVETGEVFANNDTPFIRLQYNHTDDTFEVLKSVDGITYSSPILTVDNSAYNVNLPQWFTMLFSGGLLEWGGSYGADVVIGRVDLWDGEGTRLYYTPNLTGHAVGSKAAMKKNHRE